MEKYHITADNIFNWDEKGFLIGLGSCTQRIMTLEAYRSARIRAASQDGNREFISLLACISATGKALLPALIYSGEAHCFQDTWIKDVKASDEANFATSANGWSSDQLVLKLLEQVFDPCTKKKAGFKRRLLIVDGHSSHLNMKFIDKCDQLRVLLLILPPHSTHRLQPLDVSLFSPLANHYTQEINRIFFEGLRQVSMSKRSFWKAFSVAWKKAFTVKNIESAFKKTGIFPLNPQLILDVITKPVKEEVPQCIKTPMTNYAVRRIRRAYKNDPTSPLLKKILRANERLAAEHSIDQHVIKGLNLALKAEKKRRQRGKRLNLLGEEDSGPQFYSPSKVQAARERQTAKEDEKLQKQQQIEEREALAAAARHQKEKEKVERMAIAADKRKINAEMKAAKLTEKQIQKDLKHDATQHNQAHSSPEIVSSDSDNDDTRLIGQAGTSKTDATGGGVEASISRTSRGRQVQRPKRFDN